jgi:hypothetical protein
MVIVIVKPFKFPCRVPSALPSEDRSRRTFCKSSEPESVVDCGCELKFMICNCIDWWGLVVEWSGVQGNLTALADIGEFGLLLLVVGCNGCCLNVATLDFDEWPHSCELGWTIAANTFDLWSGDSSTDWVLIRGRFPVVFDLDSSLSYKCDCQVSRRIQQKIKGGLAFLFSLCN